MKQFLKVGAAVALFASPLLAFAVSSNDGLVGVFHNLGDVVSVITPVVVAIALLGFFWGLAMYVLNFGGEEKDKKKGRDMMVYGIIVLFVMVSVWGLVQVLQNTILPNGSNTNNNLNQGQIPCVSIPGSNASPCN